MVTRSLPIAKTSDGRFIVLNKGDVQGSLTTLLGEYGQGKSVTFENLLLLHCAFEQSGVFIDPFGDLVDDLLPHIPEGHHKQLTVFEAEEATFEDNVEKFDELISLNRIFNESSSFLLCKLSYPKLGSFLSQDIGMYILERVFEHIDQSDTPERYTIAIDRFTHFLDGNFIDKLSERHSALLLSDETLENFSHQASINLLKKSDHIFCYKSFELTAQRLHNANLGFHMSEITALQEFFFYGRVTNQGKLQPLEKMIGLYPVRFPVP